jgi:UDP-glucose 4-epimerase
MTHHEHVLVAGGAGYIGSHTVLELLLAGYHVLVVDNLCNSNPESLRRVTELAGEKGKNLLFCEGDLCDKAFLRGIFSSRRIDSVVHFAGLKAVGESNSMPLQYYSNNITGTLVLLEVMKEFKVNRLVFSSSATVYGPPQFLPLTEAHPLSATNPYGRTKLFIEEILRDVTKADQDLHVVLLRYFNPTGAHPSGRIGEDPQGIPNNLMPYVAQVAVGKLAKLTVHGGDWPTADGTGVRDFIHVVDLALGHLAALRRLDEKPHCAVYNLGTGTGYSVLEMVKAFEKASGKPIPYAVGPRREGDIGSCYANPDLAEKELHWKATRGLDQMVTDMWNWQSNNPAGFPKAN